MPSSPPDHEFRVSATEVVAYLEQLLRENTRIQLSGAQAEPLSGHIVALDPAANLIGLAVGANAVGAGQRLVADGEITAVAYLAAIKLQFDLDSPVLVSGDQGAVLRCTLPSKVYRFQRRQAFRVQPAGSLFPRVLLPLPDGSHRPLRVLDISVGGLALQVTPGDIDVQAGQLFTAATLELDRTTQLAIALRIHHLSPWTTDGSPTLHVGAAFVDLDTAVLRALQVYVDQTQKRRRLLKLDA